MTVQELIDILRKEPPENVVHIVYDMTSTGGGCYDEANDVGSETGITSILSRKLEKK